MYIYIKDDETKNKLIIDGFKLDSVIIPVYSVNPYGPNQINNDILTEKIVIQKLPLHVNNNSISDFLKKYPQVKPTSAILFGKGWDNHTNNLTPFYNGNRHVYVQSPVRTTDHSVCGAYSAEIEGVLLDPTKCQLKVEGFTFFIPRTVLSIFKM